MSLSIQLSALLLPLLLVAAEFSPGVAQNPGYEAVGQLAPRDSARALRVARSEQSRFESVRRRNLPFTWYSGGGHCDERIGRFCLTHGSSGREWNPPPEPEEITEARDRLLSALAAAAEAVPGDGWVAGQRIRYMVEAGRAEEAAEVARECRAAEWWCLALLGFARHQAGNAISADSAFAGALDAMPNEEARRWRDLSLLLEEPALRSYRRLDPDARAAFEDRFWALANPLFMRPGNELRTEHLARNVWDQLQDRARSTEGISWGWDLREILMRYGWPIGWEQVRSQRVGLEAPSLISHYATTDKNLLPPPELLAGEADLTAGEWDLEPRRPRTGYSVRLRSGRARWYSVLDHQVALFRRGESVLIVAAYEVPADSLPAEAEVEAALALFPASASEPRFFPISGGASGRVTVETPTEPTLVSLELLTEDEGRAARARFGLDPSPLAPGELALSDLLLLSDPDALPDSIADAAPIARGSTRVQPGERLGVYWEIYGLPEGRPESLSMALRLVDSRGGFLRRIAQRIGLVSEDTPIRLRWREEASRAPYASRSMAIQIPVLSPGEYTLELTVGDTEGEELTARRTLTVQ